MSSAAERNPAEGLVTPCACGCTGDAPAAVASGTSRPRGARDRFLIQVRELVSSHRAHLLRIARREGVAAEEAFDAVQEAFQRYLTLPQAEAVDDPEAARKLLVTITRNEARNRRRLHAVARPHERDDARLAALPADVPDVEALLVAAEEHVRLLGCVRSLADVQRTVVTLRMLEEASTEEVARQLGLSAGHVAVLLHRAKASLAACMTGAARAQAPASSASARSFR